MCSVDPVLPEAAVLPRNGIFTRHVNKLSAALLFRRTSITTLACRHCCIYYLKDPLYTLQRFYLRLCLSRRFFLRGEWTFVSHVRMRSGDTPPKLRALYQ